MSKISELSDGGSLVSTDFLIAVRSGGNVKVQMDTINVDQVDLGDNEFIRLGNSQDLTLVHTSTQSIINQAGIGDLLLQKAGATKLTINASGIDVTGSVTADGLTASSVGGTVRVRDTAITDTTQDTLVMYAPALNTFALGVSSLTGFKKGIALTGGNDVSFYNTAGTSQALFWDASAESLGIGTSTPTAALDVRRGDADGKIAEFHQSGGYGLELSSSQSVATITAGYNQAFTFETGATATERLRIDNLGNVGLGTATPSSGIPLTAYYNSTSQMHLGGAGNLVSNNTYFNGTAWANRNSSVGGAVLQLNTDGSFAFRRAGTGASPTLTYSAVIDASGSVGIGTSSPVRPLSVKGSQEQLTLSEGDARGATFDYRSSTGNLNIATNGANARTNPQFTLDLNGNVGIGITPQSFTDLMVNTATDRNIGVFDNTAGATICGLTNAGASAALRLAGSPLLFTGNGGSGATAMSIDSSGNVGIGKASSSVVRLSVAGVDTGSSNYAFEATNSASATRFIVRNDGWASFYKSDNSASMTIDSSGNLLVGTTASVGTSPAKLEILGGTGGGRCINTKVTVDTSANHINFNNGNGQVGSISTNGTATTYNTSSDQRLKENIADADDAGSKIDAIQVRKFDWKADGSHQDYGMVAQELLEVAPEAVSQGETEEDMMGVDYSKLVPMMLKEIQSLRARIAALES